MTILIIYCHPSKESYTYNVLMQLVEEIRQSDWEVEISDLYAMNFPSDMTEEEYNREGFANTSLPIPEDVLEEQKKNERADSIIFLYPIWWSDCPAKLKGWFDRVYTVGYAYRQMDSNLSMKRVNYGLVVCTAGHPNHFLEEIGIAQSMQAIMLDDRLGKRFRHKEMCILGGTLDIEKVRPEHTKAIKEVTRKIAMYGPQIVENQE
ncbi:NAD(P)H-dependent oxidoreductase [Spirosoma harenae]